jgi:hypothetical protein
MELVDSTRLRTFQPGVDIFKQATPRHYLYIVLQGCCEYRRCFPMDVVRAGTLLGDAYMLACLHGWMDGSIRASMHSSAVDAPRLQGSLLSTSACKPS